MSLRCRALSQLGVDRVLEHLGPRGVGLLKPVGSLGGVRMIEEHLKVRLQVVTLSERLSGFPVEPRSVEHPAPRGEADGALVTRLLRLNFGRTKLHLPEVRGAARSHQQR